MNRAIGAVASGLLACIVVFGQNQHRAQVCDTDDLSDCYFIDTSVIGGLRFEDYKVTNPKAIEFDPAQRLNELAALGASTAEILCQSSPSFTTPAPTITYSNVQAQIRFDAGGGFGGSGQQVLAVEFSNFTASNGYASPSFGMTMTRGLNADGTVQRQYQIYVYAGNDGLENVVGLVAGVGFAIDPVARTASFFGTAPSPELLRQAVFGVFAHVQSILNVARFTNTNSPPPGKSLWTASEIISLAGQAEPLMAAAPDATVPIGPPFSCTSLATLATNCVGSDEMVALQNTVLTWSGEYLGLRTSQSFHMLVRNLLTWARANAPSLEPGVSFVADGSITAGAFRYSMMQMTEPILMVWPTLRDDAALAAADRLTIENWIVNTLMPVARYEASFTNDHAYFGASVQMADAIRRSDHADFGISIQRFYVALNQMRPDGSFPLEAERSACAPTYSNVDLLTLTSIAEMAATQGYDLYSLSANGKTLEAAIEFLLNARDNPSLMSQYSNAGGSICFEGKPGDPPDFANVFSGPNQPDLAWVESYIARFPFSATSARLRKIIGSNLTAFPFPLTHTVTGLNTSCAFRKSYEFQPVNGARVAIVSGDAQTVVPSQSIPAPLSVRVTDNSGKPLAGALVSFAVIKGSANLAAPAQVLTDAAGVARATVMAGPVAGPGTVTATALGTAVGFSIVSSIPAIAPGDPVITTGGILGIGASVPAVTTISPGTLFSIYGQNLGPAGMGRGANSDEIVNGVLPTTLLGVCVTVGGLSAPIDAVTPTQINAVAPAVAPGSTVDVIVTTGCGAPGAKRSLPQSVTVAVASPEFFYFAHNANGQNPVAAVNALNGAYLGPATIAPGFRPAHPGDLVTVFASGFGPTNPPIVPGGTASGAAHVTSTFTVTLGSLTLAASDVLYAGAAPGLLISQLNIRIPSGTPEGNQQLQIRIGGIPSPLGAFLTIASP